jgi:hypothetical protein
LLDRLSAFFEAICTLPLPHAFHIFLPGLNSGRLVLLAIYITVASCILTAVDAPVFSQHFLDDVAFRAAWLALTQIPLVYLLSTKRGPINLLAGISYERVNWLHRWVARVLLLSITVHVVVMKSSIATLDIMFSDEKSMSIVRYGIGAYSTLLWIAISSILPLRKWSYRIFYINHWTCTVAFLGIVFQHVPSYARPPIHLAASLLVLDKGLVGFYFLRNNISVLPSPHRFRGFGKMTTGRRVVAGYAVELLPPSTTVLSLPNQPLEHATTIIRIDNVPLTWRPGQHIRAYIPALGPWEAHPFTPANCSAIPAPPLPPRKDVEQELSPLQDSATKQTSNILLMIKAHKGLTRRLAEYNRNWLARPCPNANDSSSSSALVAYVDGPYGFAPQWEEYENLVLLATGTGISFTLAILDCLEQLCFIGDERLVTRTVRAVWMVRHVDPLFQESVEKLLNRYSSTLSGEGMELTVDIYTSCPDSVVEAKTLTYDPFVHLRKHSRERCLVGKPPLRIRNPEEVYAEWDREAEAEMRELGLGDAEPYVADVDEEDWYAYETDAGSDISETDTLVNGNEEVKEDEEDVPVADPHRIEEQDSYVTLKEQPGCQCARIQHTQRRKPHSSSKTQEIINRYYGTRCNISDTLSSSTSHESTQKTMVAVCSSRQAARQAQKAVSSLNWTYALGKRTARAELHVEGDGSI